jgi:AcrR family transcriptional regulator
MDTQAPFKIEGGPPPSANYGTHKVKATMTRTAQVEPPKPRTVRTTYRGVARRAQILETATRLFLEHGYAGVSVDAIVSNVGGSKTNVYSHFGSKEGLFTAVVTTLCESFQHDFLTLNLDGLNVSNGLKLIGKTLLRNLLQEDHIAFQRLITAESGRYPALAEVWFQAGPNRSRTFIAEFLEKKRLSGEFKLQDTAKCADLFHSMLVFDPVHLGMIGRRPNAQAIDKHVDHCVNIFLK